MTRFLALGLSTLAFGSLAFAGEPPPRITAQAQRQAPASPFRSRLISLASDPAHGNEITRGSLREAYVGLRLERAGVLKAPIKRELTGAAEFMDGQGMLWDVKAFNSNWPVKQGGFEPNRVRASIAKELARGQRVILDRRNLSVSHAALLAGIVFQQGWGSQVAWYPQREP